MQIELETRRCAAKGCTNTFSVMPNSNQMSCSIFCEDKISGTSQVNKSKRSLGFTDRRLECQKLGKKTIQAEFGLMGPGEQKKESKSEKKLKDSIDRPQSIKPDKPKREKQEEKTTQTLLSKTKSETKNITKPIEIKSSSVKTPGEKKIKSTSTENRERIMPKTEKTDSPKLNPEEGPMIPQLDSTLLSKRLNEEREGSIQLLTSSAERLAGLAESLSGPIKKDDEGEVIQRRPSTELDMAIRCLSECRNCMKTKLEYIKLGVSLMDANK